MSTKRRNKRVARKRSLRNIGDFKRFPMSISRFGYGAGRDRKNTHGEQVG